LKWHTAFLDNPESLSGSLQIKSDRFFAENRFVRTSPFFDQLGVAIGRSTNDNCIHLTGRQNLSTLIGRNRSWYCGRRLPGCF
jgi:hypothetical protein